MAIIPHDCPHCGTPSAPHDVLHEYRSERHRNEMYAFLKCDVCTRGSVISAEPYGNEVRPDALAFAQHYRTHPAEFIITGFYPDPGGPEAPDHLPPNVKQFFIEAVQSVKTAPNAAGSMYRKSLDVGLKIIDPESKGNLVNRIAAAEESGLLTKELAEWAHHIRLDGNDAAHDEDPFTPEEAEELHKFTDLVMRYLFTLPGMLREIRERGARDEAAAPEG